MIGIKYNNMPSVTSRAGVYYEEDRKKCVFKNSSEDLAIDGDDSGICTSVITPTSVNMVSGNNCYKAKDLNKKGSILKSPLLRLTRTKQRSHTGNDARTRVNNCSASSDNGFVKGRGISDIESDQDKTNQIPKIGSIQNVMTNNKDLELKPKPMDASNLSVVVTRDEVVVKYRNKDEDRSDQKQSSQFCSKSVDRDVLLTTSNVNSKCVIEKTFGPLNRSALYPTDKKITPIETQKRKGIMKRQRYSNLAYHHPQRQRALPPPNYPPPGYDVKTLWRRDYNTRYGTTKLGSKPNKRVSFDEASLTEQSQLSQQRRRMRFKRREVLDHIFTALPMIFAVSILVASSFVPLPQSKLSSSSSTQPKVNELNESLVVKLPRPVIIDVASRMWDERKQNEILNAVRDDIVSQDMNSVKNSDHKPFRTFSVDQKSTKHQQVTMIKENPALQLRNPVLKVFKAFRTLLQQIVFRRG